MRLVPRWPLRLDARPRISLILLCLVLWLPGFFVLPPTDRDESRFAEASKQMLETGDYVRIMNGAEPRNRKPIGIYWLQVPFAAAARAADLASGNPIWPYRIPALLGAIAAVLATFQAGIALFADRRTATLAAAMLAASLLLTVEAHLAKTDAALCGATTACMAVLATAWHGRLRLPAAMLFWALLGLAILIKGPIAPMVVGLTALSLSLLVRDGTWLKALRPTLGIPLLLAVILPWFIAIGVATHGAFFADAVGGDLGRKLGGGEETHGGFPGEHLLLLPLLAFPATAPVVAGLAAGWRDRGAMAQRFLLCWLVPSWLVFEAVPTKLPHYTLPLYPALFLLAGRWLATPQTAAPRSVSALATVLPAAAATVIAAAAIALPVGLGAPGWLGLPALLAGAGLGWLAASGRTVAATLAAPLLYAALLQAELPMLPALWLSRQAAAAVRATCPACAADGSSLVATGYVEPSLMFLAGPRIKWAWNGETAANALAQGRLAALVAQPQLSGFLRRANHDGLQLRAAAVLSGFDYSRGRSVTLRLFLQPPPATSGAAPALTGTPAPVHR